MAELSTALSLTENRVSDSQKQYWQIRQKIHRIVKRFIFIFKILVIEHFKLDIDSYRTILYWVTLRFYIVQIIKNQANGSNEYKFQESS